MSDRLPGGIYFRRNQKPAPSYRLLLLNVRPGTGAAELLGSVSQVWQMLCKLPEGGSPELLEQEPEGRERSRALFADLEALLAIGRRLFDDELHDPPLAELERPAYLSYLPRQPEAFPALPWTVDPDQDNLGEADLAIQLTGSSEAAVNCAAVEIWKLLVDQQLPLEAAATFDGFGRSDGRGWLEFHDGVGNLAGSQRLQALECQGDPSWMAGGTFMAFLRFAVDLTSWRTLPRTQQELLIGRDKLSGSPLVLVGHDQGGRLTPVAAPAPGAHPTKVEQAEYRDPPQTTDPVLEASHLHRANQNRGSASAPAGARIFRQGYEFLSAIGPDGPRLGLNFVSFQADLASLQHILQLPGWLGDVNFGGPTEPGPGEPDPLQLITLEAGGFYAVPPQAEPFPGAELFAD
jgi:deferrochelatase/peroxidase EfeB